MESLAPPRSLPGEGGFAPSDGTPGPLPPRPFPGSSGGAEHRLRFWPGADKGGETPPSPPAPWRGSAGAALAAACRRCLSPPPVAAARTRLQCWEKNKTFVPLRQGSCVRRTA
ncbi:uncharacterized protein O9250_009023 [Rhynochetos jubatus]